MSRPSLVLTCMGSFPSFVVFRGVSPLPCSTGSAAGATGHPSRRLRNCYLGPISGPSAHAMNPARLPTDRELSPAVEELLDGFNTARGTRLTGRGRRVEALVTAFFLAELTVTLAAFAPIPAPPLVTAAVLVVGYALAQRVCFPVGAGYAAPTQLFFVPMLLLVPAVWAPLLVMA